METFEIARLMPGAQRVNEGQSAYTYRGKIDTADGESMAYIKIEPPAEMVADAAGAWLGRLHGLNIPMPFWVVVDREDLPAHPWPGEMETLIAFALLDARGVSFKQWLRKDSSAALATLISWKHYPEAAIFDEWIANTDRNLGNILFDGDIWLIDHGHALGGPSWEAMGLVADEPHTNLLLDARMGMGLSNHERYQWRKQAAGLSEHYQASPIAPLREILDNSGTAPHNPPAVVAYLERRAQYVVELLCHKLGLPELPMASALGA